MPSLCLSELSYDSGKPCIMYHNTCSKFFSSFLILDMIECIYSYLRKRNQKTTTVRLSLVIFSFLRNAAQSQVTLEYCCQFLLFTKNLKFCTHLIEMQILSFTGASSSACYVLTEILCFKFIIDYILKNWLYVRYNFSICAFFP